jgi:dipeptidyl aminopeptidase/acylaminoacyl peptidase
MKKHFIMLGTMALLISCQKPASQEDGFSLKDIKLSSDVMTPETLWSLGRIGDWDLSPDGQTVVYSVSYPSIKDNKSYSDVYTIDISNGTVNQITNNKTNEFAVTWRPDGKKIGYLSSKSGEVQLWEMNTDGSDDHMVSSVKGGITNFQYAPNLSKLLFTADVKLDSTVNDLYPDLPLANARIETDLMYRHWDHWHDFTYSHAFIADYTDGTLTGEPLDIMKGEKFDTPLKPFGGIEELTWSPDSKSIVYTSKKLNGKAAAFSTNSDLYIFNTENGTTTNLTQGIMGYDRCPVFSPDGKQLVWESMSRDGYEADKIRLMLRDMTTGETKDLTSTFDQNVSNLTWDSIGQSIWFISDIQATDEIYKIDIESGAISRITNGIHDYTGLKIAGNNLIATKMSMSMPTEIYKVDATNGTDCNLSKVNEKILNQLQMGKIEKRWITTSDNKQMLTWVIYPPHFDPSKKYPTLLYCEGGPQSTVSQFWSYRWNFQQMAANGYIVVAPNRRGLPGFGQEWNEQISGDYGGQNMLDFLSAIDAMAKEPFVDANKLGAIGASYGGFSVYWLAGHHNKRFKAFISHCGIFNFDQMYVTTEEMFFVNWDYKGAYWDTENAAAQRSYSFSPHLFVKHWDTPILVIHGEKDFRIPYTQGMGAFNAAVMRGVSARFLFFPEENHWILSPQNGILWQREFKTWLDKWVK